MCAPASLGLLSAGGGLLGSIGGFMDAQAKTKAANESTKRNYKYQLKVRENDWMRATNDWDNRKINFSEATADNSFAAQEGYARAQRQLNEVFKSAAFAEQGDLVKLLQSTGAAASGQVGKSAQRIDDSMLASFGRNNATRAASLASSKEGYQQSTDDIRRQLIDANEQAFDNVAFAPTQGVAPAVPVLQAGPNPLTMLGGAASAVSNGFNTFNSLQPPKVGTWSGFNGSQANPSQTNTNRASLRYGSGFDTTTAQNRFLTR